MWYVLKVLNVRVVFPSVQQLKDVLRDTFRYNVFLYLTITSSIIIVSIDTLMISSMKGTYDTGVYTIAFFIATVIEIPQRMLVQVASPILSNKIKDNKIDELKNIYQKSSMIQLFIGYSIFILIWFNLDAFYAIMPNGELYKTGTTVVLLISASKIIDIGFGLNKQIIEMSEYFNYNLYINVLLSILVIVLNLVFIPQYGINGAALASLLAVSTTNVISFFLVWFKSKIIPFSKETIIIIAYSLLTGLALHYFLPAIENPWLSIILNSLIMGVLILILAYFINMLSMLKELKILKS
jgi:O-antigen/teichoic acid export membrane protein